jgi:hypothetical protein
LNAGIKAGQRESHAKAHSISLMVIGVRSRWSSERIGRYASRDMAANEAQPQGPSKILLQSNWQGATLLRRECHLAGLSAHLTLSL